MKHITSDMFFAYFMNVYYNIHLKEGEYMILYHINNKPDVCLEVGKTITIGKDVNYLFSGCYNLASSFLYNVDNSGKEPTNYYKPFREFLSGEKFNQLTEEQKQNYINYLNEYLRKSNIFHREIILEEVRKKRFRRKPSRQKCIYLTDLQSLEHWVRILNGMKNKYEIYEVETMDEPFVSTDSLLPNVNRPLELQKKDAEHYWKPTQEDLRYATDREYLYTGELKVLRRVK